LWQNLKWKEFENVRNRSRSTGLGVDILASHVVEEVVDVGEEVLVGEVVVVGVMNQSVVAQSAPQKPYHPSPVHDSKRCGFGGLLSRLAVHAASRDEEDSSSAALGTGGERKK
jgi:hypothetical protein